MLIVMAEVVVKPGTVDQVRDALTTMEIETRKEDGCATYAFSVDVSDPNTLRISERWESMDALKAHFKTPHMATFGGVLGKHPPVSMEVKLYEVARELPLPR
jgi:quinol monooxygenase YgiN